MLFYFKRTVISTFNCGIIGNLSFNKALSSLKKVTIYWVIKLENKGAQLCKQQRALFEPPLLCRARGAAYALTRSHRLRILCWFGRMRNAWFIYLFRIIWLQHICTYNGYRSYRRKIRLKPWWQKYAKLFDSCIVSIKHGLFSSKSSMICF